MQSRAQAKQAQLGYIRPQRPALLAAKRQKVLARFACG